MGEERILRHDPLRDSYDMALMTLVEQEVGIPDLICLAGYDLWIGDRMVDRYYPRILNVHPGDARKYTGLRWIPIAKAVLAGEESVKSTVFFVDKIDDGGPILIQSASLPLSGWDKQLRDARKFAERIEVTDLREFRQASKREGNGFYKTLEQTSSEIQDVLKEQGDWKIFPFAVHDLIAKGRIAVEGGTVYIDDVQMPPEGYQVDEYGFADRIS